MVESPLQPETVLQARRQLAEIHIEENVEQYIVNLVGATRHLGQYIPAWEHHIEVGASPRASLALVRAASAWAYLHGREYLTQEDVIEMLPDVLRHRIITSFAAQAENTEKNQIIQAIIEQVPMP